MNIEQYLKNLKKEYQKLEPSQYFIEQGWPKLKDKILETEIKKLPRLRATRAYLFLSLVLLILLSGVGVVQASQKSLPGEPLYPVKVLSEKVITKVTGNKTLEVENRAKEIIDLSKKEQEEKLKETVEKYRETILKTKKEIEERGKEEKLFKKKLKKQQEEFEKVIKETRDLKGLEKAIEVSKKGQNGKEEEDDDKKGKDEDNKDENGHQKEEESGKSEG